MIRAANCAWLEVWKWDDVEEIQWFGFFCRSWPRFLHRRICAAGSRDGHHDHQASCREHCSGCKPCLASALRKTRQHNTGSDYKAFDGYCLCPGKHKQRPGKNHAKRWRCCSSGKQQHGSRTLRSECNGKRRQQGCNRRRHDPARGAVCTTGKRAPAYRGKNG